jgi:hypothetical protein
VKIRRQDHQSVKPGLGKDLNAVHEDWGVSIKEMVWSVSAGAQGQYHKKAEDRVFDWRMCDKAPSEPQSLLWKAGRQISQPKWRVREMNK